MSHNSITGGTSVSSMYSCRVARRLMVLSACMQYAASSISTCGSRREGGRVGFWAPDPMVTNRAQPVASGVSACYTESQ